MIKSESVYEQAIEGVLWTPGLNWSPRNQIRMARFNGSQQNHASGTTASLVNSSIAL